MAVSIFVNPIQFNNQGDLKNYPRTLEKDLEMLNQILGENDFVFAPSAGLVSGSEIIVEIAGTGGNAVGLRYTRSVQISNGTLVVSNAVSHVNETVNTLTSVDPSQTFMLRFQANILDSKMGLTLLGCDQTVY